MGYKILLKELSLLLVPNTSFAGSWPLIKNLILFPAVKHQLLF